MPTLTGLFDTYPLALAAARALHQAGIDESRISLVAGSSDDHTADVVEKDATTGAEIGAGLGAAGGLLAGLGIVAIPGLGLVVAGGWLIATVLGSLAGAGVGAATGSLIGALTSHGVEEPHAHLIAEHVRSGGALVTAHVEPWQEDESRAILGGRTVEDLVARREAEILQARRGGDADAAEAERVALIPPAV